MRCKDRRARIIVVLYALDRRRLWCKKARRASHRCFPHDRTASKMGFDWPRARALRTGIHVAAATKDLLSTPVMVQTPLAKTEGRQLAQRIGLIPILRAGLGMVDPVLELIPTAEVWHLGLYRDEETAKPVKYYSKLPPERPVDVALILDPMLATGGSAVDALTTLRDWGVKHVKLLSLIAAEEGVKRVNFEFPNSQIYVCQIDPILNDRKFIVPGLGDAGDRIFNTMHNA